MLQSCAAVADAEMDVPGAVRLRRGDVAQADMPCAVWAMGAHDSTPESILTVRARSVNQPPGTTSSHLPREKYLSWAPANLFLDSTVLRAWFPFPVRVRGT